ncbi:MULTISPECIES: hypothetical protein [Serratia]|uniref:Uncharacterized protein n=1 Tax=Serratia odorifera TaxID=618 RepID=A0A447KRX8_SEROD|nr:MULTISPECIES: hypothetical protein [Serratia]QPT13553.1 hypothetical protein I6G37_00525 [Serratia rubidaea]PNK90870.1 hypothetical protein CEQ31_014885 [Serratia odorifera]QNK33231.1 hypothetical protein HF675_03995 [Serratia sp. JUb9]RII71951.1 hypothetical protein DX901_11475 [Serratia odorifera]VDZ57746.1 Uncharacterised protein [Serratia odorifera]
MNHQRELITPAVSASPVARCTLIKKLGGYGFIECSLLVSFLQLFCNEELGVIELQYIRDKAREFLVKHDNQSDYFSAMRQISQDTHDAITRIIKVPL